MRDQGKQMKVLLDAIIVVGSGANNAVMITQNGSHEVLGVQVQPGSETATIERGIKEALADANKKLQSELVKVMQANGGGMDAIKNMLGGN